MSQFFDAITRKADDAPVAFVSTLHEIYIGGVPYRSAGKLAADHGLSRDYIARLARHGTLRGCQLGTHWYVDVTSFKNFLVLRAYERAARRKTLIADRQREFRDAQTAVSQDRPSIAVQEPASLRSAPAATENGGLRLRLLRLCIQIRLDRAPRSS
jgi:hypothetical protein